MAVLVAILCTFSIGAGEFVASDATKRARSHEVTSMMFVSGALLTGIVAFFWPGEPTQRDLAFGAVAGALNGMAILLLYMAYSRGSLRSAAPSAAVVMTGVPVLWDILTSGERPGAVGSLGIILGILAIALSSYEPDGEGDADGRSALGIVIAAGVIFGVMMILLGEIGNDAGGTPLFVQRWVGLVVAVVATRATGPRVLPERRDDKVASFVVGIFATSAIVLFVVALQLGGSLSMVSVVSSQYAGVAVLLAFVLRGQRLRPTQSIGLALASIAVALITLG